ncbi:hypothetical protein GCM10011416_06520 [Polaribacter pacificus]|uniref:Tetratricopeptide repeat protein 21A/21B fifth ARM repeats domain-containing protein n=1 Tax=Polaribacter pacificus TaxID=1775173 RepID=A0A917HVI3_9FLAO|nr:hypothetical protein GCM10011416_06520 [Polaribacter pacificus]
MIFAQSELLLAENYFRKGEYEKAEQLYQLLFDKNPQNTTYLKRLISCFQETAKFTAAEELLQKQLTKRPNETYLYVELGYNYDRQQLKEQATTQYKKALESIDKYPEFGGYIARLFKENSLLDFAIEAYQKTMQLNPDLNYNFQIAQIYGEQGSFEKMFTAYINLLNTNDAYLPTVQRFTSPYITDDPEDKNNILFKKVVIKKSISNPKNVWNQLLSWVFTQQKEYDKAFIQEKALFQRNPEFINNIINLGVLAYKAEDYKIAQECFDFVKEKSPLGDYKRIAASYVLQIAIEVKQPDIDKLFSAFFDEFGQNSSTFQAQLLYANYLTFQKDQTDKAILVLNEAMKHTTSKFNHAKVKLQLGDIYVYLGKFNKALIEFSKVQTSIKDHPISQEARFKVAQTSYFKNDFDWAKAQLKVLKASTTQLIANDALELFLIISNNQPKDSTDLSLNKYAKTDLLAFQEKNEAAILGLQSLLNEYKGYPIEDEALYKQAGLFVKTNQLESAIKNYLQLIAINKEGILVDDAYYQLAELYSTKLNNTEKASEYYQKIIFEHPSSIYLVDARKKFRKLRGDAVQ